MGNRNGSSRRKPRSNVYTSPEEHQNVIGQSKVTDGSFHRRPASSQSAGRQQATAAGYSTDYGQHNESLVNSQNQYTAFQQQQQQQQTLAHQSRAKSGSNSNNNAVKANSSRDFSFIRRRS